MIIYPILFTEEPLVRNPRDHKRKWLLSVSLGSTLYPVTKPDTKSYAYQSHYACYPEWAGRKYKPFSHTLHVCLCQCTKNTYWANRAFMRGITIHEARSSRDAAVLPASMLAAHLLTFLLCKLRSCVSPAGHWSFQLWWVQISSPECWPLAVFMRPGHV